jgi:hypothetical protein
MKNILTTVLIVIIIFFCFRQIGDKFIYGWVAGILATFFSDLTNKKK